MAFSSERAVGGVFNCTKCMELSEDGKPRFSGLVIDGTATGILGNLPDFNRPAVFVPPAKETARLQFILPSPKLRVALTHLFKAASEGAGRDSFDISLPKIKACQEFVSTFLTNNDMSEEITSILTLMRVAYDISKFEDMASSSLRKGKTRRDEFMSTIGNKLSNVTLRTTLADFALAAITSSIPLVLFPRREKIRAGNEILFQLAKFSKCEHNAAGMHSILRNPCVDCAMELMQDVTKLESQRSR